MLRCCRTAIFCISDKMVDRIVMVRENPVAIVLQLSDVRPVSQGFFKISHARLHGWTKARSGHRGTTCRRCRKALASSPGSSRASSFSFQGHQRITAGLLRRSSCPACPGTGAGPAKPAGTGATPLDRPAARSIQFDGFWGIIAFSAADEDFGRRLCLDNASLWRP